MEGISLLSWLYVVVGVMLIVVLYHILFIVVDLRRVLRRLDSLTAEVESLLLRPLSMADTLFQWLTHWVESLPEHQKKHEKK